MALVARVYVGPAGYRLTSGARLALTLTRQGWRAQRYRDVPEDSGSHTRRLARFAAELRARAPRSGAPNLDIGTLEHIQLFFTA